MTDTSAHLSIGEVLGLLQQDFPDVTISKIRFLESQGLIDPERTPSGYRKFYEPDIERLRWILHQQRENFLPLKVIKDRLENGGPLDDRDAEADATIDVEHDAVVDSDAESLVDAEVGAPPLYTEQFEADNDSTHTPAVEALPPMPATSSWQDDPTMELDFAALSESERHADNSTIEESAEDSAAGESTVVAGTDQYVPDAFDEETVAADVDTFEPEVPAEPETTAEPEMPAQPDPVGESDLTNERAPEDNWGPSELDQALATPAPEDHVDVDLVEIETSTSTSTPTAAIDGDVGSDWGQPIDRETDEDSADPADAPDTDTDTDTDTDHDLSSDEAESPDVATGSVTERLRRGDLREPEVAAEAPDAAVAAESFEQTDESADASAEPEPVGAGGVGAESTATARPAVERYFSSEYSEPLGAMAMDVEELAGQASLTVSQIRELEHFGIIVGESVGPDVIYNEECLAVAQAASTFLERGLEPRHLRPFAMAADREIGLYEQLALPVLRKRDPGTRVEADKLLGALYESGTELRALLVKRGIRNTIGR